MPLFDKLGFRWDRSNVPVSTPTSVAEILASFRRRRAEVVYDASALEGNPLSFQEVAALLAGDPVSGHDPADLRQVRNLAAAAQELAILVEAGRFRLNKTTSDRLHALIAREEALEWGQFRGEGQYCDITPRVSLGVGTFIPSHPTEPGAANLKHLFAAAVHALEAGIADPRERGMAYFLFGALQQFYFDGNKRTARFMMNGILMSNGIDVISIPPARAAEFDAKMVPFYTGKDATEMMKFLIECQACLNLLQAKTP